MAKIQFDRKLRLYNANRERLRVINGILDEYVKDGFRLTLRQLYYQLVARDIIANEHREYVRLSNILKKGRMAGVVDWDAIEDRIRRPQRPYWAWDIPDALEDTYKQFRINRQVGQEKTVEIWVEKDALSGVLSRVTSKYHVRLMVNRGYSSVTAMYRASRRFQREGDVILYFGDHDPSGLDMIRDIKDRLWEFGKDVEVIPVALTMEQIKQYNPPPDPAKVLDPRADWYMSRFGHQSWELDALTPKVLMSLAEDALLEHIDEELYLDMVKEEEHLKAQLRSIIDNYKYEEGGNF